MKLELRGITKTFGALVANDHIDLTVEPGEIHCLLGENGAGKSTLMNVLYGLLTADSGEILLDDVPQHFKGPGDAMRAGIGMVHQHFMLIPVFTVAENVMLGHEPTKFGGRLDLAAARKMVRDISGRFGFDVDPDAKVEDLPVGIQQRVEIIKALSRDARVLVFDEPTAVLTPQETDDLMGMMRQLKAEGKAIVFITHKLREVREVADRITVIRLGKVVGEASPTATNAELATLMVGRDVDSWCTGSAKPGAETLVVDDLVVIDRLGAVVVDHVSFDVRAGEIVGVAGVQGNGQTELAEAIVGLHPVLHGRVLVDGVDVTKESVAKELDHGVGYVPEDRSIDGLVKEFTIAENLMLDRSDGPPFVSGGALQLKALAAFATDAVREYDVRTPSISERAGRLSGGNQQKVVLARELSRDLRLLIASQPTRGVDVGSIEFIHQRIVTERDGGAAVLVVSTELEEIQALSDRIIVMYRGRIMGIVPGDTGREALGLMMAGELPDELAKEPAA